MAAEFSSKWIQGYCWYEAPTEAGGQPEQLVRGLASSDTLEKSPRLKLSPSMGAGAIENKPELYDRMPGCFGGNSSTLSPTRLKHEPVVTVSPRLGVRMWVHSKGVSSSNQD